MYRAQVLELLEKGVSGLRSRKGLRFRADRFYKQGTHGDLF